jgi:hypothetical protein
VLKHQGRSSCRYGSRPDYFWGLPGTCSACSRCTARHDFIVASRSWGPSRTIRYGANIWPARPYSCASPCGTGSLHNTFGTHAIIAPHTQLQAGISKPKIYKDGIVRYGNLTICEEPTNIAAALSDPNWKQAMESEFSALMRNNTWHLVPQWPQSHWLQMGFQTKKKGWWIHWSA